ncbi:diguanylate cyclase [bacterium]|nr:diguanylate cyclase [bacterium]
METNRDEIIRCLNELGDSDQLIEKLEKIIEREGDSACRAIFHVLTHLDLEPEEAHRSWQDVVDHRRMLSDRINRAVDIRTAICDFFHTVNHILKNPKVVEIHVFEGAFKSSRFDGLTGLFNRPAFEDEIAREMSLAKRYDTDLSLLFFDLDNFKRVNDQFGHLAGDLVLKQVATTLLISKRAEDIAVRYGGEELLLILPKTEKYNALLVGKRICQTIRDLKIEFEGAAIPVTVSGGLASFPVDAATAYHLVKTADEALYRAKQEGKDRVVLFTTNKRRYTRLTVDLPLEIHIIGAGSIPAINVKSKNFSMNGILFEYGIPIELGTKIQMMAQINPPDAPVKVIGTVVRVEKFSMDRYDIGISISFQEMAFASRELMVQWYQSLIKKEEIE